LGCGGGLPMVGAAACLSIATKSSITGSGSIGGGRKKLRFTIAATIAATCTPADRIAGVRISTLEERPNIDHRRGVGVGAGAGAGVAGLAAPGAVPPACSPSRPSWRKPESITTPITSIMRP